MAEGIEIQGLSKNFRGMSRPALRGVSLNVEPGTILGIIGPNGAGKTTLMGCLLGFLTPDSGYVKLDGVPPSDPEIRRGFGYVPERLTFDRWMKARDFVRYHHALAGLPEEQRAGAVAAALDWVGLSGDAGRPIRKFSRGMLQRLGMAQALIARPRFLFLDEPTSGMDPKGVVLFKRLVKEAAGLGACVVLNSHQLGQVEELCDRVCFLEEGRLRAEQSMRSFRSGGVYALKWAGKPLKGGEEALQKLAEKAGAELVEAAAHSARFRASHDEARAALISGAVEAGLRVVEAAPEARSLETFFEERP